MISNQILQNTIDGLKSITRTDLCVIDVEGRSLQQRSRMRNSLLHRHSRLSDLRQTVRS